MSQHTTRRDPRAKSGDEDVVTPQPRPLRARKPVDQPDGGPGPDEPGDSDFELAGDDDLGPGDLGPLEPGTTDPDTGSDRIGRIFKDGGRPSR